jgi:hypothetical protein
MQKFPKSENEIYLGEKLAKQENICLSTLNERVAKEKVQKYEDL